MAILTFYYKVFVIYYSVSVAITMSVHKTAGSQYFGIMPPKHAKVTHKTLPAPEHEGYQLINDASYYYNQANNHVYNLFKQFFGTSDEEDPQIYQGVYKCEKGDCKKLDLNPQQTKAFHEKLKGKTIQLGNALTTKVEQIDHHPSSSSAADHANFENHSSLRKVDSSES